MTRAPTEMEECCAREVYDKALGGASLGPDYVGDDRDLSAVTLDGTFDLYAIVRTVARAMREPTEDMADAPRKAGVQAGDFDMSAHEATQAWWAMIDSASPPESPADG